MDINFEKTYPLIAMLVIGFMIGGYVGHTLALETGEEFEAQMIVEDNRIVTGSFSFEPLENRGHYQLVFVQGRVFVFSDEVFTPFENGGDLFG